MRPGRGTTRRSSASAAIMTKLGSWWEVVASFCASDAPNRPALPVPKGRKGLSVRRRWEETCLDDLMGWRLWGPFYHGGLLTKSADGASLSGGRVCSFLFVSES